MTIGLSEFNKIKQVSTEALTPDFIKQKKALAKIKEHGFEGFASVKIREINADSITKTLKSTDHGFNSILGMPKTQAVQKISGTIVFASPLFGAEDFTLKWEANPERHNGLRPGFIWSDNISLFTINGSDELYYSGYDAEQVVPNFLKENAKQLGLSMPAFDVRQSKAFQYYLNALSEIERVLVAYIEKSFSPGVLTDQRFDNASYAVRTDLSTKTRAELDQELITTLSGGEVDSKFVYLLGGAEKFIELLNREGYRIADAEKRLLREQIVQLSPEINNIIIDLGCGDGSKAKIILGEKLRQNNTVEYCPVDISPRMIYEAANNAPAEIKTAGILADFTEDFKSKLPARQENATFLLLGNTLSNGDNNWQSHLLTNIRAAMNEGDNLIIGAQMAHDFDNILTAYREARADEIARPMIQSLGLNDDEFELYLAGDADKKEISLNIKILQDKTIYIGTQELNLPAGKEIKLIISHKFTPEELNSLIETNNLKIKTSLLDNEDSYGVFELE